MTTNPGSCEKLYRYNVYSVVTNDEKNHKKNVATMNEELEAKFYHKNWKLCCDIKESIRLENSIATQKFYVATQSRAIEGNSIVTENLLSRHTIKVFNLQAIQELLRHKKSSVAT